MTAIALPRSGWRRWISAVAAGGVAALGQAPFDLWYLSVLGFAAGIALVSGAERPARVAWAFGLGHFGVALHWITEPFFVDAATHGWMAPFGLFLMAGGMALFWLAAGLAVGRLKPGPWRIAGFSAALILTEGLRAYILSGFPWAHPGHILIDTALLPLAAVAGPHGLNLLVLAFAAMIAGFAQFRPAVAVTGYVVLVAAVLILPPPRAAVPDDTAPMIRLVQPNAPQHLKWQPDMIEVFFERGLALSEGSGADLVVWPETSLPVLLEDSGPWRQRMAEATGGIPIVTGAQRYPERRARNTLALLAGSGDVLARYDKHHLVPFGEYIPLRGLAARAGIDGLAVALSGGFWPGEGPQAIDLGPGLGRAFVMICYEAIFPQYLARVDRPDWQLHITNDAWFGTFSGPYQHFALARLRAAESGLPLLRSANTGISAAIDGRGAIIDSLPLGVAGALDVRLPPALPPTVYSRMGDLPVLVISALLLCGIVVAGRQKTH